MLRLDSSYCHQIQIVIKSLGILHRSPPGYNQEQKKRGVKWDIGQQRMPVHLKISGCFSTLYDEDDLIHLILCYFYSTSLGFFLSFPFSFLSSTL